MGRSPQEIRYRLRRASRPERTVTELEDHRRLLVQDIFDELRDGDDLAPDVVKITRVGDSEGAVVGLWRQTGELSSFTVGLDDAWRFDRRFDGPEPSDSGESS